MTKGRDSGDSNGETQCEVGEWTGGPGEWTGEVLRTHASGMPESPENDLWRPRSAPSSMAKNRMCRADQD